MISDDPTMRPVVRLVLKAAVCQANVLLVGESGVGKTYIAREIHQGAGPSPGPFVTLFGMPDEDGRYRPGNPWGDWCRWRENYFGKLV